MCINQTKTEVKNHQVSLMAGVYSRAYNMFSWLGTDNEESDRCIDAYNLVSNVISQPPNYSLIIATMQEEKTPSPDDISMLKSKLEEQTLLDFADVEWLKKHYDADSESSHPIQISRAMKALFKTPYWSRVWISQKLVLARMITLLCRAKTASWDTVCRVSLWTLIARLPYPKHWKPGPYLTWNGRPSMIFPFYPSLQTW
jgi:hypothetical protein